MKFWLPTLALVASVSLPVLAQEAPPNGAMPPADVAAHNAPTAQQFAAMRAMHEQFAQVRRTERLQMLGSLTPAHRAALANLIGQYAIAPNPDPRAAAAQIDALLANNEKTAVLTAENNARTSERAMMEAARTQMEASASPDERAKMQAADAERAAHRAQAGAMRSSEAPDAGRALLHLALAGESDHAGPGGDFGPRGFMPGGQRPN